MKLRIYATDRNWKHVSKIVQLFSNSHFLRRYKSKITFGQTTITDSNRKCKFHRICLARSDCNNIAHIANIANIARYQELVTHRRVVVVVVSIWVYSAFVSLMILWETFNTRELINTILAALGFIITFVVYIRIYQTVRRHKNQIQSMQIRDEAQSEEKKNFTVLMKSTVGIIYVYLVFLICYLPYLICMAVIRIYGLSIALKKLFLCSVTLMNLNSSLNPVIYCWKMKHIRHAIMEILRKVSWISNRPLRINYNRSSSVVHIHN